MTDDEKKIVLNLDSEEEMEEEKNEAIAPPPRKIRHR